MTPLERLLAEELPTGAFGGERPRPEHPPTWTPTPPRVAEEHREVLLAALSGWEFGEHDRAVRHLRALPSPDPGTEPATDYTLPAAETG
ncbi:hypothetical protein [Streptomyces antimycoticus]